MRIGNPLGLALLVAIFAASVARAQTIIRVSASAQAGGNGQSWATAFNDLQSALSLAATIPEPQRDVQIWVAAGVYKPSARIAEPDPQSVTFSLLNRVQLMGGFVGTESTLAERVIPRRNDFSSIPDYRARATILSGEIQTPNPADNAFHVVLARGTDATAVLDGFLVELGN